MLSLTKDSRLKPEDVISKTVKYFGPNGYGLLVKEQDPGTVYLEGGGGGVRVLAQATEKGSKVDLETREWENQSKDFFASLK
jgi:hypothetical protein